MLGVFIARFIFLLFRLIKLLVIAYAILSWFPLSYSNPIVRFVHTFTEPILAPIRNFLLRFRFFQSLPIDFSPIVLFLLLDMIQRIVIMIL